MSITSLVLCASSGALWAHLGVKHGLSVPRMITGVVLSALMISMICIIFKLP